MISVICFVLGGICSHTWWWNVCFPVFFIEYMMLKYCYNRSRYNAFRYNTMIHTAGNDRDTQKRKDFELNSGTGPGDAIWRHRSALTMVQAWMFSCECIRKYVYQNYWVLKWVDCICLFIFFSEHCFRSPDLPIRSRRAVEEMIIVYQLAHEIKTFQDILLFVLYHVSHYPVFFYWNIQPLTPMLAGVSMWSLLANAIMLVLICS